MAPFQDQRLEKLVDEVLKSSNVQALEDFMQEDISERTTLKCSKQFLTKLDKFINIGLNKGNIKNACLGLSILHKCGTNLVQSGGQGLSEMVSQGLVKKWYEKARQLWVEAGTQGTETLLNLAEDFFDAVMVVHDASKDGTYQVTESLLYPIGQLVAEPRVHIIIQKEAIRKLNLILDKIPVELKREKKILSSQEASDVMSILASRILESGDYDLQIGLMEALCRMTTKNQRKELADRWFTMEFVASAFSKIQDSEFETDCRKFLNLVNGMQGDKRRVLSYPCLEVFLDKHELLMPSEEKLEEFWIDFNLGSQSISFYFSLADESSEEGQWDTVCIPENDVHSYTVTEEGQRRVLRIKLSEPVCVSGLCALNLTIHFSSSLDITQAAHSVYGLSKDKTFMGKSSTSVVKTTVKIIMDESSSQTVVPESQMSLITKSERSSAPCLLSPCPAPLQLVTPAKRRVSESCSFITSGGVHGISPFTVVIPASTPSGRTKPALELVGSHERPAQPSLGGPRTTKNSNSCTVSVTHSRKEQINASLQSSRSGEDVRARAVAEKYRRNIPADKVVEMVQADQDVEEEPPADQTFVPDSQPTMKKQRTTVSVSETLMPAQRGLFKALSSPGPTLSLEQQERPSSARRGSASSAPGSGPVNPRQLHAQLTQRLQEVLREREQQQDAGPGERGPGPQERAGLRVRGGPAGQGPREPQQQTGRQPPGRGRNKGQKSKDPEPVPVKAPIKPTPVKAPIKPTPVKVLQEKTTPNPKVKLSGPYSSKEKRDAEVTGSMVKLISSHYEKSTTTTTTTFSSTSKVTAGNIPPRWNHPATNRSLLATSLSAKKDTSGFLKSYSNPKKSSGLQHGDDVFAFSKDSPISVGGKRKKSAESSAIDSSAFSWALPSTTKKDLPGKPQPPKRHVRKHLFSDTDTDAMTEVSWLRESSRKPKAKITNYSRQPPAKTRTPPPDTTFETPDLPPASPKPVKQKAKPKKKSAAVREASGVELERRKEPAPAGRSRAARRPQRAAAAAAKSYREPDSDSQSEAEQPPAPKKRSMGQQEKSYRGVQEVAELKKKMATAPARSYEKPYNSQSDTEQLPAPKRRFIGEEQKKKASAPTRSSKEPCNDSQSETVPPTAPTKRRMGQQEKSERGVQEGAEVKKKMAQLPSPKKHFIGEEQKRSGVIRDVEKTIGPAKKQTVPKDSWAARLASFSPSPPPVERMRSVEEPLSTSPRSPLTPLGFLTASLVRSGPPSPVMDLPNPPRSSSRGFQPSSFYSAGRESESRAMKTPSLPPPLPHPAPVLRAQRPSPVELQLSPIQRVLSAQSPPSECSQPPLTSTALEKSPPESPLHSQFTTGDTLNQGIHFVSGQRGLPASSDRESESVSRVTLSQSSSVMSVSRVEVNPVAMATNLEKTPYFDHEGKQQQYHMSGPSHKHHNPDPSPSNSEEEEEEEVEEESRRVNKNKGRGRQALKMRPRKLFKSSAKPIPQGQGQNWEEHSSSDDEEEEENKGRGRKDGATKTSYHHIQSKSAHDTVMEVSPEGEVGRRVSSHSHTVSSSHWEASVEDEEEMNTELPDMGRSDQDMGTVCRQFSSELRRKCQNRTRRMELYTKQSLKTVQQHVSSVSVQVSKHRCQKLEKVRGALLEEIKHLEQDDTSLKTMEKELTTYWRKQSVAFHTYHEKETRRLQGLKRVVQTNVCHSLEYEEQIFSSQMCLMKKDMKSVQDRLFKEMQEEELLSVRRGLQALFVPEGPRF